LQLEKARTIYNNEPEYNYLMGMSHYLRKESNPILARRYVYKAYKAGYQIDKEILSMLNIIH